MDLRTSLPTVEHIDRITNQKHMARVICMEMRFIDFHKLLCNLLCHYNRLSGRIHRSMQVGHDCISITVLHLEEFFPIGSENMRIFSKPVSVQRLIDNMSIRSLAKRIHSRGGEASWTRPNVDDYSIRSYWCTHCLALRLPNTKSHDCFTTHMNRRNEAISNTKYRSCFCSSATANAADFGYPLRLALSADLKRPPFRGRTMMNAAPTIACRCFLFPFVKNVRVIVFATID